MKLTSPFAFFLLSLPPSSIPPSLRQKEPGRKLWLLSAVQILRLLQLRKETYGKN